jgi:photosystem II stability/assembly factor-like uncharacterized protein
MATKNNHLHHLLWAFITLLLLLMAQTTRAQWSKAQGFNSGKINVLNTKGQLLYAGTDTGGIYASTDFGLQWFEKNNGITNKKIVALVLKDSVLIAGVGDGFGGALFVSKNDATSWQVPSGNYNGFLFCLAQQGNHILAGTWYGVAKSTDNGETWNTISTTGLPSNASVTALLASGTTIFAGVSSSSVGGTGIFRSTDNGDTWVDKSTGIVNKSFTAIVQVGNTLLAATKGGGVYASTNNGDSWTTANTGLGSLMVNCLFAKGNNVLAGTNGGIFLSTDNAATWTNIGTGLPANTIVNSITTCGSFLLVGTDTTVWRRQTAEVITHTPASPIGASVSVYPNPSNGVFTIDVPANTTKITVTNPLGQTVYQNSNANTTLNIALPTDTKGVYFVQLKTTDGIVSKKILVE